MVSSLVWLCQVLFNNLGIFSIFRHHFDKLWRKRDKKSIIRSIKLCKHFPRMSDYQYQMFLRNSGNGHLKCIIDIPAFCTKMLFQSHGGYCSKNIFPLAKSVRASTASVFKWEVKVTWDHVCHIQESGHTTLICWYNYCNTSPALKEQSLSFSNYWRRSVWIMHLSCM